MSGDEDFTNLSITELHYHPDEMIFDGDTISGKELEFIHLVRKTTSLQGVN